MWFHICSLFLIIFYVPYTTGKKVGDTIDVKLDLTDRELHQITSQFDSHDLNRSEYLGDGVDRISMKKNGEIQITSVLWVLMCAILLEGFDYGNCNKE